MRFSETITLTAAIALPMTEKLHLGVLGLDVANEVRLVSPPTVWKWSMLLSPCIVYQGG